MCRSFAVVGLTVMVGLLPNAVVTLGAHGTIFNVIVTTYQAFQVSWCLCSACEVALVASLFPARHVNVLVRSEDGNHMPSASTGKDADTSC